MKRKKYIDDIILFSKNCENADINNERKTKTKDKQHNEIIKINKDPHTVLIFLVHLIKVKEIIFKKHLLPLNPCRHKLCFQWLNGILQRTTVDWEHVDLERHNPRKWGK